MSDVGDAIHKPQKFEPNELEGPTFENGFRISVQNYIGK